MAEFSRRYPEVAISIVNGTHEELYNLLRLELNRPILDNIIFLGLPAGIRRAGQPQKHEKHAAPV